jgi:hypothetical protein
MQVKNYPVSQLSNYALNPRIIDTYKYQTLITSLKEFPQMLQARPLIIDENHKILCGNMRYRACIELGYTEVPAKMVKLSDAQKQELIVKDNLLYGEWDDAVIDADWDRNLFDKWMGFEQVDYSNLNYEDLGSLLDDMSSGVKKAIQIDFGMNFEEAKELEKQCRAKHIYIGGVFIDAFKNIRL